jgi:hypothetical protein
MFPIHETIEGIADLFAKKEEEEGIADLVIRLIQRINQVITCLSNKFSQKQVQNPLSNVLCASL